MDDGHPYDDTVSFWFCLFFAFSLASSNQCTRKKGSFLSSYFTIHGLTNPDGKSSLKTMLLKLVNILGCVGLSVIC